MNVKETILADLITAMKAKDSKRLQVLRSLKAKLLENSKAMIDTDTSSSPREVLPTPLKIYDKSIFSAPS